MFDLIHEFYKFLQWNSVPLCSVFPLPSLFVGIQTSSTLCLEACSETSMMIYSRIPSPSEIEFWEIPSDKALDPPLLSYLKSNPKNNGPLGLESAWSGPEVEIKNLVFKSHNTPVQETSNPN